MSSLRAGLVALALPFVVASTPAAAAPGPKVEQLVVFRGGAAVQKSVRASATTVKVGRRRCAVARATPLAALARSKPGRLGVRDYGSCSRRAADGVSLFVRSIRGDVNRGQDGWVYKVGRKLATAGAGDPSGAFGSGRLRRGQRVTWFYCRLEGRSCQRTLALKARADGGGSVLVTVRAYDDEGRSIPANGATVSGGGAAATTGPDGTARLALVPGRVRLRAIQPGAIRSFSERVTVR